MNYSPSLIVLGLLLFFGKANAQKEITLNGSISDANTNTRLDGVNIYFQDLNTGTSTDSNGSYSITLPAGKHKIIYTFLGYATTIRQVEVSSDTIYNITLSKSSESLDEIILKPILHPLELGNPQMINTLSSEEIKKLPVVLGEADVIKSLLLLPGVTNLGEGSSGFNVRGGSADQNLVLLDQASLFGDSHLFGFFSVVNSDAIQNLKLYKGGIPTKYGGRASSVLAITQKTGNKNHLKGQGGIGVISSRLQVDGPLKKGKSSFLVSGRSSYAHLFLKLTDNPNSGYFYDLNTKWDVNLNENNSLFFSGYFGRDVFNVNNSFKNKYGDGVAALQWDHQFSDRLKSNLYITYSDYYFGLTLDFIGFNYKNGINKFNFKYDFEHELSKNFTLNYGVQTRHLTFNPGYIEPSRENSGIVTKQFSKKHAWENDLYLQADQNLSKKLAVTYGFRLSNFNRLGQSVLNHYKNDDPIQFNEDLQVYEKAPIISTSAESKTKIMRNFWNLEPRFSLAYQFNEKSSFKANYQRITQYIQKLSNTSAPTPFDIWTPSGKYIQPIKADQWALGYFRRLEALGLNLETELFYKNIQHKINYVDGADLITNEAIEQVILDGKARAYGLELLLRKTEGKFTGMLSYTLSRTEQKTPGRTAEEPGINQGNWYNNAWDKTHDISLTGNFRINKKWALNAAFVFQTGRPITYPTSQYVYDSHIVPNYGKRNAQRLPSFHHLDISATLTPKANKNRNWKGEWIFGIYNIYDRKNTASLTFAENEDTRINEATRLSIFGIIPSVTYNFKF